MVNHIQKAKKKSPKPGIEGRLAGLQGRSLFTVRTLSICILFLVTLYLISPGLRLQLGKYKKGEPADRDVFAEVRFEAVNLEATRLAAERAASLTPPVYILDSEAVNSSVTAAKEHFGKIAQDALNPVFTREERIALISKYLPSSTSAETIDLLAGLDRTQFNSLQQASIEALEEILREGVLSDLPGSAKEITIVDRAGKRENTIGVDRILTLKRAPAKLERLAAAKFPDSPRYQKALRELLNPFVKNTLTFDEKFTQIAQEERAKNTPPVMNTFVKGDLIVMKGMRITEQDVLELQAHAAALSKTDRLRVYVGNALLLVMVFSCFLFYIHRYRPEIARSTKALLLVSSLVLVTLLTGRFVIMWQLPDVWLYIVPVAAGGILISTLVDDRLALVYAFFISMLYAVQGGNRFDLFLIAILGSLGGIYYLRTIRKRSDIFRPGIVVCGVNALVIVALALTGQLGAEFTDALLVGLANGLITAIGAVPGAMVVLESAFGIATNIRLLELSDLNHPLLKRLAIQAPGTFHHSLMVGNMAEAAAEQVGANSLLARVGSYYHDIGKMNKPLYFSENQGGGKNKHDELTPNMSALVLIAHVKEGVELAREHRLNQPIIEFIQQHHGTSLMPFFYQKALEQDSAHAVKEENFRYPGPRPQSREAAICMLADSVEAASRTLVNPTHGRIKGLVEKIINNKFVDSQLDECELTLQNLHKIADSFTRVLAGYLHSRVEYPEEQTIPEIREKFESADTKVGAKTGNKTRTNSRGH